ncbi:MAG TPA: response regulator [Phycisphaerae bacterium]|nr:response regulator [Phycisphaerae bacterium]
MVMKVPEPKTILAVDQDPRALLDLMNCLSKAGFNVQSVISAADAMKILRARRVDAITLNASLTGEMDGFRMAAALGDDPRTRDIPVILLANNGEKNFPEKCKAAGVKRFMSKPYDLAQLVGMVKDAVAQGELDQVNIAAGSKQRQAV